MITLLIALVIAAVTALATNIAFEIPFLGAWLISINLVTVFVFWFDKRAARIDGLRVPEYILLILALVGGSPGALLAMQGFRHKTRKRSFQIKFWLIVIVQIVAISLVLLIT